MSKPVLPFRIDTTSGIPIYVQLIDQVKYHIARGVLRPGDEMPSVRTLATDQLINPNTVVHAYRELEREGLIHKRRGMGTYVAERPADSDSEQGVEDLRRLLERAAAQGRHLGIAAEELHRMLDEGLDALPGES
jgi:GntR family transcriptional regulator